MKPIREDSHTDQVYIHQLHHIKLFKKTLPQLLYMLFLKIKVRVDQEATTITRRHSIRLHLIQKAIQILVHTSQTGQSQEKCLKKEVHIQLLEDQLQLSRNQSHLIELLIGIIHQQSQILYLNKHLLVK